MENTKNELCQGIPHFCSAGMQVPKLLEKPEIKIAELAAPSKIINKQKPWSVFGDVYWI